MKLAVTLCAGAACLLVAATPLAAQDTGDLAARVKKGEGWGTSAVTSGEVADCWATWTALREHVAQNGRGSLPADYTVANLDSRIADWDRAMAVAFEDYPDERGPRSRDALQEARAEVGGGGLASRAESSGACKTLPGGSTTVASAEPAVAPPSPAPAAPASASASASASEAEAWRAKGKAYALGTGVAKDPQQAVFWIRKAAEAGLPIAQLELADGYYRGYGGLPQDPAQSTQWTRRAAEAGLAAAQFNMGLAHLYGEGVSKDPAEAARWFRLAAEQGDAEAQSSLGARYWFGDGVAQNHAEAVRWFRKAAEQGDADGQFWLGNAYRRSLGVDFDIAEARRWLRASAAQGDERAANMLDMMAEVDREFAARERAILAGQARRDPAQDRSLYDEVMATVERQRRENCAAAAQGANRSCPSW